MGVWSDCCTLVRRVLVEPILLRGVFLRGSWAIAAKTVCALADRLTLFALSFALPLLPSPPPMTEQTVPFVIPISAAAYLLLVYVLIALAQRTTRLPGRSTTSLRSRRS